MNTKTLNTFAILAVSRLLTRAAAAISLASLLASVGIANATPIYWGTQYLKQNDDGTHNWSTTVYNNFDTASTDYAIVAILLGTTLANGYNVVPSSSEWSLTGVTNEGNPYTDIFSLETQNSGAYIYPIAFGAPDFAQMTIFYTTPSNIDRLGQTSNTFWTDAAGGYTTTGWMPVPEPTTFGLVVLGLAGLLAGRKREENPFLKLQDKLPEKKLDL